jgi:hypothetical protein
MRGPRVQQILAWNLQKIWVPVITAAAWNLKIPGTVRILTFLNVAQCGEQMNIGIYTKNDDIPCLSL